jgi:hypothetical protein
MNTPMVNAIAIDPDQISTLTYTLVSVRVFNNTNSIRQSPLQQHRRRHRQKNQNDNDLDNAENDDLVINNNNDDLFRMNSTHGHLYALKTEMPCGHLAECVIHIQYRADDRGRFKTRVSRKRMIKLHVKPLPLSLFNINEEVNDLHTSTFVDYKKTFELIDGTSKQQIVHVNEDTKIGEKCFKIGVRTRGKSLVFFSLLDATNFNQTFYLSNSDGSLYLIKPLDFELKREYNLTILVTNWVGQIEYVSLRVNVRDINDNVPIISMSSFTFNETLDFNAAEDENIDANESVRSVPLVTVHDGDVGDNFTHKIEDCFYLGVRLLLKKPFVPSIGTNPATNHLNYPLCSRQFIELVNDTSSSTLNLRVYMRELKSYLFNLTDFYLRNETNDCSRIEFHMDISVKDSSQLASIARVNLNFDLVRLDKVKQLNKRYVSLVKTPTTNNNNNTNAYGFRKSMYFIDIKRSEQLRRGAEYMRLNEEFINYETISLFKPFSLKFNVNTDSDLGKFIRVESTFGRVYLSETLFDPFEGINLLNETFIFEIKVKY